jgi:hypothetical protein
MAGKGRARNPDGARSAQSARAGSVALGLIPAPEVPEKIANEIATELPELLASHVDCRVSWGVSVVVDPLTGTDRDPRRLL